MRVCVVVCVFVLWALLPDLNKYIYKDIGLMAFASAYMATDAFKNFVDEAL